VKNTDSVFLKHFAQVIAALFAIMVLLIIGANAIYADHPPEPSKGQTMETNARIAPVGGVYSGESGRAAMLAAEAARNAAAAAQVAYDGTLDGSVIFGKLCQACHMTGAGGAPKMEKAAWTARSAQGMDMLVKHAIEGYTGSAGVMPARGGNPSLTDEQVKATVEWMMNNMQ
jgi:cytochrome c5